MGKGKGSFDYWAARVGVSRMVFELKGELHEEIVRDAFRLAGNKMPGEKPHALPVGFLHGSLRDNHQQVYTSSSGKAIHLLWVSRRWSMELQEKSC